MRRIHWLLPCLLLTAPALAAQAPVEASMVLTGTITVSPDGAVKTWTLRDEAAIPPGVVQIVRRTIDGWRFVPILENGKPVTAKTGMAVRVVADMVDDSHATIRVAGATFGCDAYQVRALLHDACKPGTTVTAAPDGRPPPTYPTKALRFGMGGEVYLDIEVGRDGRVTRVAARQVNLSNRIVLVRPEVMRHVFAENAEQAAKRWRFQVPTIGPEAVRDHWVVRVEVNYSLDEDKPPPSYGKWRAYIPGPVHDNSWAGDTAAGSRDSADAIAGDGPFTPDARFVLKAAPAGEHGQS